MDEIELQRRTAQVGLTATEVGRRIGRHQTAVSRVMAGAVDPRHSTFNAIRQVLVEEERRVLVDLIGLHGLPETWEQETAQ